MRIHGGAGLLGALLLVGCGGAGAGSGSASSETASSSSEVESTYVSEAERTREMETRADEATRRLEEARASGATGEEAVRAYEEFERERAALESSGGEPDESTEEYAPAD